MRCPHCGLTAYPADIRLGIDGFLSPQANRLVCLAAVTWSFDVAAKRLDEIAGLRVDDETIRRHTHQVARQLTQQRDEAPPRAAFEAARVATPLSDVEFFTDGVMAPTREGWREVKIARFQIRPRGEAAEVADWANRDLPAPTASVCYATTADCATFSSRWTGWAEGLGIDPTGRLTALGDGAAWIWSAVTEFFPAAEQVLDIFHASQHLAAMATSLYGESTTEATRWHEQSRSRLLADGWLGLLDHIGATLPSQTTPARQAARDETIGYFAKHTERVGYFGRLHTGQSIGSGAVESMARQLGDRLKVPGRGWCVEHIDGMTTLINTVNTPEWPSLWLKPAA